MALLGSTIQVVIAIALVVILCVVAFLVYNAEMVRAIKESGTVRRQVSIFSGIKDLSVSNNEAYNTINPSDPLYRNLENSVNQKAGAEYTYNFWLYMDPSKQPLTANPTTAQLKNRAENLTDVGLMKDKLYTAMDLKPFVLLLRGDDKAVPYKSICDGKMKVDVLVKQPMIKLERNWDVLTIELNTQDKPDVVKEKSRNTCDSSETDWNALNSYRVGVKDVKSKLGNKWNMVTLIIQDTYPSDPLPIRNKVRVRLYVNGMLELDRYVDGRLADTSSKATLLRQNNGNLFVAPQIKAKALDGTTEPTLTFVQTQTSVFDRNALMMADLTYFNYAIDTAQIKSIFDAGFNRNYAPSITVQTPTGALTRDKADMTSDRILTNL